MAFESHHFEAKLRKAIQEVKLILAKTAQPPSSVQHTYQDKFHLVERVSLLSLASLSNSLATLGLRGELLKEVRSWDCVSLSFKSQEKCSFLREETWEEEPVKVEKRVSVGWGHGVSTSIRTSQSEYVWNFEVSYHLELLRGVGQERRELLSGEVRKEMKTSSRVLPQPESNVAIRQEVDLSYLLKHLSDDHSPRFCIDRTHRCTPRRNAQVEELFGFFGGLVPWVSRLGQYLHELQGKLQGRWHVEPLLGVVLPLFCEGRTLEERRDGLVQLSEQPDGLALGAEDCNRLLQEEARRLAECRWHLETTVSGGAVECAYLASCMAHIGEVMRQWSDAVSYVEHMLYEQLFAAIGQELTMADFGAYMRYHHRRIFKPKYVPTPLSFAVRRSEHHSPEGLVTLEENGTPIENFVCTSSEQKMSFRLDASTTLSFTTQVHLHACLLHQFAGEKCELSLVSRARQFSHFLLLLGRLSDGFQPMHAILVQNKDELRIPLHAATIPSAVEFRDAISSLSSEQQAFAKAFREMQLESTLFGLMVIQVKPQLEQLLNLPKDSLTKEIKLTQDLMRLFMTYQIPCNLLLGDGIEEVRRLTGAIDAMIDLEKAAEVAERIQRPLSAKEDFARTSRRFHGSRKGRPRTAEKSKQKEKVEDGQPASQSAASNAGDFTRVPKQMEEAFERLDPVTTLRPSIITPASVWQRRVQEKLLAEPHLEHLDAEKQRSAKLAAYDLLDALTKSGALALSHASMHIVMAHSHCFEKTVMDTVLQESLNPIEEVERSSLIMASSVHQQPVADLISDACKGRIFAASPQLLASP